jgi:hypothetical protein
MDSSGANLSDGDEEANEVSRAAAEADDGNGDDGAAEDESG